MNPPELPNLKPLSVRLRRLRQHPKLRQMLSEHQLSVHDLILPLFIYEGENIRRPIRSMPGHYQLSLDHLDAELAEIESLGISAVLLFGIPKEKDACGHSALTAEGVIPSAIRHIKAKLPHLIVISDVCFCEYTSHGHCGVLSKNALGVMDVDNDATLPLLAEQAVVHARAGADIIAPSGMMDGMVQAIRHGLDHAGFTQVPILSYAVKFASGFYGPFREAAEGAPKFGDRKTYQMDPANVLQSLREAALDVAEGADMLMVKPAQNYLDVVYRVKQAFPGIPLAAYQVSGEFAMIKAAAEQGWLDEKTVMLESLLSIKRAGADMIITYFAKSVAQILRDL